MQLLNADCPNVTGASSLSFSSSSSLKLIQKSKLLGNDHIFFVLVDFLATFDHDVEVSLLNSVVKSLDVFATFVDDA